MVGGRIRRVVLGLPFAVGILLVCVVVLGVSVWVWHHDHNRQPSSRDVVVGLAVWMAGGLALASAAFGIGFVVRRVVVRRERRRAPRRREWVALAALLGAIACLLAAPKEVLWGYGCNSAGGTTSQWGRVLIAVAHPGPGQPYITDGSTTLAQCIKPFL